MFYPVFSREFAVPGLGCKGIREAVRARRESVVASDRQRGPGESCRAAGESKLSCSRDPGMGDAQGSRAFPLRG